MKTNKKALFVTLLVLLVALLCPSIAKASYVQGGSTSPGGSQATITCSPNSGSGSVTAGHVEVMSVHANGGGSFTGISSTNVTTWTPVNTNSSNGYWYGTATSSGVETITVTLPGATQVAAVCDEYTTNPFDTSAINNQLTSSQTITTTVPNADVVCTAKGGTGIAFSGGSGFTLRQTGTLGTAPTTYIIIGDIVATTPGTYTCSVNQTSAIVVADFGVPAAPPGTSAIGSRYDNILINQVGHPIVNAKVYICTSGASGTPCSPKANIFSDINLTIPLANPLTTGPIGNYGFYAAPATYLFSITGPNVTSGPGTVNPAVITLACTLGSVCGGSGGGGGSGTINSVSTVGPLVGGGTSGTITLSCPSCNTTNATIGGSIGLGQIAVGSGPNTITSLSFIQSSNNSSVSQSFFFGAGQGGSTIANSDASATNQTGGYGTFGLDSGHPGGNDGQLVLGTNGHTQFRLQNHQDGNGVETLTLWGLTGLQVQGGPTTGAFTFNSAIVGGNLQAINNISFNMYGATSGNAGIGVGAVAGTPCLMLLPTVTATANQVLSSNGACPQQLSWVSNSNAFSAITSATNSNAGSFILSGNTWDARLAAHTFSVVTVAASGSLPGSCVSGELGFVTGSTAGQNLWECLGGVWTQQLNSGAAGASTSLSNLIAVALNTSIICASVNTCAFGSNAIPNTNYFIGTVANQAGSFDSSALTTNRVIKIPDAASSPVRDCPAVATQFLSAIAQSTGTCSQRTVGTQDFSPNIYIVGAGAVNVMTATLSPAATSLTNGLVARVLPNLANTTTNPTLNVNGLGAVVITKFGGTALVAGDYSTTSIAEFVYNSTVPSWELQNPQSLVTTLTSSSVNTLTSKTIDAEATGNSVSLPNTAFFSAGGCNGSTFGPGWDIGTTSGPTAFCGGNNSRHGGLLYTKGNVAYINWRLPKDWNSSSSTDIRIAFTTSDTTNGHVASFNVQTACNAVATGAATDDPTFNAFQAASVTIGASQITGGELVAELTGMTMTGCAAKSNFIIAITRNNSGTDTDTDATLLVKSAEIITGVTKNATNR